MKFFNLIHVCLKLCIIISTIRLCCEIYNIIKNNRNTRFVFLQNFNHPGLANHQTVWDLSQSLRLRDFLHAVDDKANQNMIRDILDQFENEILPKMDHFQAGMGLIRKYDRNS